MNSNIANIYGRAPVWAQNLLLSMYGVHLHRQRFGGRFSEYRDELSRTERWPVEALQSYQDEKLRAVIRHAYDHVPYYRRTFESLKLTPADIQSRSDLPKIPLLTRDDVRRNFDTLWSTDVPPAMRLSGHTSGTTGTPLTIGYDHAAVWMTYAVFDRHYQWAGVRLGRGGDRIAVARGNVVVPLNHVEGPFWRFNRYQNQMLLSSFHLSTANLPFYFEALQKFRPDVIDGYPSTLYVLAKYLKNTGQTFPVKAAITSSETLYDFQRELIEERFACQVFDYYALAERVVFSGECGSRSGHHLAMEYGVTEVVDERGEPQPEGIPGKLVATGLHNKGMPLIRYLTGDMTAVRSSACSCGRQLALMDDVTTKAEDMLTLKDGRLISPSVLTHPFKPLDSIEGSQIVQTAFDAITVKLVAGPGFSADLARQLKVDLQQRLGESVTITIDMVDRLDTSKNGKFKWVVSKIPLGL